MHPLDPVACRFRVSVFGCRVPGPNRHATVLNAGLLLRMADCGTVFRHPNSSDAALTTPTSWGGPLAPAVAWPLFSTTQRRPRPSSRHLSRRAVDSAQGPAP